MSGMFITAEGGEGSGKTTHVQLLAEYLRSLGHDVLVTKEPGSPKSGLCQEIRSILLKERDEVVTPQTEMLLFYADRAHHLQTVIRPALEAGAIILCDRFNDSTKAYQSARAGIDPHHIQQLTDLVLGVFTPDLTLFFDPGEEEARRRMGWRNQEVGNTETRIDNDAEEFHQKVWANFRAMASRSDRFTTIDSSGSIEATQALVQKVVTTKLGEKV